MELTYDTFISRLFDRATQMGTPLSGTFELTSRCTLDCKMCYIHSKENDKEVRDKEKPTKWWLDLAKKAQEAGTLLLLLTGGECMLRDDFEEIYLACKKMGFLVTVNTNATLINEKKIKLFKENPPQRVNITLYGTSKETYGNLCGVPEAFDRVMWAIKSLKEAGINLKINYTVTPYNKHDVFGPADLAGELEIPIQTVTYLFPPLRACGECGKQNRLSPEEAAKVVFDLQKYRLGDFFNKYLEQKKKNKKTPDYFDDCEKEGERINCRAGLTNYWVTWDGKMTPCGMMVEPSAEIGEDFNAVWNHIRKAREEIILPPQCTNCEYKSDCDICAAVSYAETGRFDGLPTYVCEKAKAYTKLIQSQK